MIELILTGLSAGLSAAALAISLRKQRKPTLAGAALRAAVYARSVGGTREEQIRTACLAVIREDEGDNGKRDWPDHRVRQEVQALFRE